MRQPTTKIAYGLFALALLKALILALMVAPGYGADGAGYLQYVDAFKNPSLPDAGWYIWGTTPVYPFFAYAAYLFGLGSGYTIVLAQVMLGGLVAPAMYLALRPIHERAGLLAGVLIALDPQTGQLFLLVSTEALYIALLGLGMAALFWNVQKQVSLRAAFGLGLLLGLGSLARPVGLLLIVPYLFFYALMTRSSVRSVAMSAGYVTVVLILSFLSWWRFDFFAPSNSTGIYLAARLFSVGDLYDRNNGAASEQLYQLAADCDLELTGEADEAEMEITQNLRLCLYYTHAMSVDDTSRLYEDVYAEATRAKPGGLLKSMAQQLWLYVWKTSDAYDLQGARHLVTDCDAPPAREATGAWYESHPMFCPTTPTPLAFLAEPAYLGMLGFSIFTRILNFVLAALLFSRANTMTRWLLLFCLAIYGYHAVVTAFAGTVLSRYITVTNTYLLVTLAFGLVLLYEELHTMRSYRFGGSERFD